MSTRDDEPFAHAMTDLMSGVAVTFLLIASIFMMLALDASSNARKAQAKSAQKLSQIETEDSKARRALEDLRKEFNGDVSLKSALKEDDDKRKDPDTLTLTLDRKEFSFKKNECELTPAQLDKAREPLRKAVETVCRAVIASQPTNSGKGPSFSISLEGHTDNNPFFPGQDTCGAVRSECSDHKDGKDCRDTAFNNNVRLSGARAQNLFFELRRIVGNDEDLTTCLDKRFTVAGRGSVEPIGNDDENRRVVLKVRVQSGTVARTGSP